MDVDTPIDKPENPEQLSHYLLDNLPAMDFDVSVACKLAGVKSITVTDYIERADKPVKVVIDARTSLPSVFNHLMSAYLDDKQEHPHKTACIITNQNITSGHQTMRTLQHKRVGNLETTTRVSQTLLLFNGIGS